MAKKNKQAASAPLLFEGVTFVFEGKGSDRIQHFVLIEGGTIAKKVTTKVDVLLRCDPSPRSNSTVLKNAKKLNDAGTASIEVLTLKQFFKRYPIGIVRVRVMLETRTMDRLWLTPELSGLTGDIESADLRKLQCDPSQVKNRYTTRIPIGLVNCDLRGAQLSGMALKKIEGGRFAQAEFVKLGLGALLDADLTRAKRVEALDVNRIERSRMKGADLTYPPRLAINSEFIGMDIHSFSGPLVSKDFSRRFTGCTFKKVTFRGVVHASFKQCCISNFSLPPKHGKINHSEFENCELVKAKLEATTITDVAFTGSNLTQASFAGAIMNRVSFQTADLTGVDFRNAKLINVNFNGAKVDGANFYGAALLTRNAKLPKLAGAKGLDSTLVSSGKALSQLEKLVTEASKFYSSIELDVPRGKPMLLELERNSSDGSVRWSVTEPGSKPDGRNNCSIVVSLHILRTKFPKGAINETSVKARCSGGKVKGAALRKLVTQAWCEMFKESAP